MPFPRLLRGPALPACLTLALWLVTAPGLVLAQQANLITVASLGASAATDRPSNARGDLLLASDGNFYVATFGGGTNGGGTLARITPSGTVRTLFSFSGSGGIGAQPYGRLIQASDGNLYGTTYVGGTGGRGTVFRATLTGDVTTIHSFSNGKDDPFLPYTGVVQGPDGNLYGTTLRGGPDDAGSVFRLSLDGQFTLLHAFTGSPDGENPEGELIVGADGNLYGTTLIGGEKDRGTIYRITPGGTLTTIFSFPELGAFNAQGLATNTVGANPRSALLLGADGNYYGTGYQGGAGGWGTIFRMTPSGDVTALHSFTGPSSGGGRPIGGVTQDAAGNLFGTSERGGNLNRGSAWRLAPDGTFSLLHGFSGGIDDGETPYATLLPVGNEIFGVSFSDTFTNSGTVFKLDLGTNGVLPVNITVSPTDIETGGSATLTWSSPDAVSCKAAGAWADPVSNSGTLTVTPLFAGFYNYVLGCTDSNGVLRNAYAALAVRAPPLEPVDGGGDGGGSLSPWLLLLLAGALLWKVVGRRGSAPA